MLKHGEIYQIRYVPRNIRPPFVGGSYATGEDIHAPIRGEALTSKSEGVQNWRLDQVEGEENTYTISTPGFQPRPPVIIQGPGPVLAGWGYINKEPFPRHEFITFSTGMAEWVIEPAPGTTPDQQIYTIARPDLPSIEGPTIFVDLDHESDALYGKAIPIVRDPPVPVRPHWQFIPAGIKV